MFRLILAVFLGSGTGGVFRYLVSLLSSRLSGTSMLSLGSLGPLPVATLAVNLAGCFLIGLFYAFAVRHSSGCSETVRLMLTTGFCGGLTTFSTFSQESLTLIQSGHIAGALLYIGVSLIAGLAAVYLGTLLIAPR